MTKKAKRPTRPRAGGRSAPTEATAEGHFRRGLALQQRGKAGKAAAAYGQALEADPNHLHARNNLGNMLRDLGQRDAALTCYHEVIARDPGYALAHYNLGNMHRAAGDAAQAAACFRRAVDLKPDFADACNNLGVVLQGLKQLDEATACFYRAVAGEPRHHLAHFNLGNVLRDQGRLEEAAACYRRAIDCAPRFADARCNLGDLLRTQGKLDESRACYLAARKVAPDYAMVHFGLAETLRRQEKFEAAMAAFDRAIALDPKNADILNNRGNTLRLLERIDEAQACYRAALAIDPENADARLNLAIEQPIEPHDPDFARLKALLGRTDRSADQRNQVLFALARGYESAGDFESAMKHFAQGNAEMAARMKFDRPAHGAMIRQVRELAAAPPGPPAERPTEARQIPVFLLGMSRSGKTLVESLLKQDARVFGAGERSLFLDSLEWVRKSHAIEQPYPACLPRLTEAMIAELGARYMAALGSLTQATYLLNALPGHYLYLGLIFRALPAAKAVFCRREPLDLCLSIYRRRYGKENAHAYGFQDIAAYHDGYIELMEHWRRLYGHRILDVQYESLVAAPHAEAERIFRHLGLDTDTATLRADFGTHEIGRWRNYQAHLGPLRAALAGLGE